MTTAVSFDLGGEPPPTSRETATDSPSSPGTFGPLGISIEDLPGPAFILDGPEGRVTIHNASFAAWAGRDDPQGLALADLLPGDPGAPLLLQEARAAGTSEHHVERRGPGGEATFWSLRARRTPAGVLVCAADLTALAGAARAVHAPARDYVAVAAHELRAPLSAIKAWAGALDTRRGPPGSADAEGFGAITRQVDRMNDLLTDLLEAARAGSGTLRAERAPVTVASLLGPLGRGARLSIAGDRSRLVFVDAAQIEALLGRLIGWLAARTPGEPISVLVTTEGAEVHLDLTDRGPALSRRAASELFGRALRAGRGLGLYLCQQLAACNGARVWREQLPHAARLLLALPGGAPSTRGRAGPARVLVDAEGTLRERTVAVLRLEGYEAFGAPDAASLLRDLDDHPWDVVVTDLRAREGGDQPLAALPRIRARAEAVVVLAPSAERSPALDGAERAGALGVLCRPIDWPHLVSLVGCAAAAR